MILQNLALGLTLGAAVAIYFPMIAKSAQVLGSAPLANVPFFGIAFVSSLIIAFTTGSRLADFGKFTQIPPILLTAGVMSAGLIIGSSFLIPRIGLGTFVVLLVAGQIIAGFAFGQIGIFGIEPQQLSIAKVAGAGLVIAGVSLVSLGG
ncbi:MAG: DMT family transporter [Yoonia sp.]|uniref:DMT family transporter n=1 Tax=Yoonia sp. TaxID=2212373 RepID=UPI003EF97C86